MYIIILRSAPDSKCQPARVGIIPAGTVQLAPMPVDIFLPLCIRFAGKETSTTQVNMVPAERNYVFEEPEQPLILLHQLPIEPANLVILAISIVVSLLRPPDLISAQEHRNASREEQNRRKILDLQLAQRLNVGIVRCSLDATIPAQIIVDAIPVILAVGLVVLVIVGNQVIQGEAIVTGDEIDAIDRHAPLILVEIRAARDPRGHSADQPRVAFDKATDIVAEAPVPFRPAFPGKVPDLVKATGIPRLGNNFCIGKNFIQ